MYQCLECSATFKEADYFEKHLCPYCLNEEVEEMLECNGCGEYHIMEDLHDTEGMINGGCGLMCSQCLEDYDIVDGIIE